MNQSLAACEHPQSKMQGYTHLWRSMVLMGLMLLAVAGWFYLRNLWHFGTAFHGNWQAFPAWFPPGVRWPNFYLRWGDFLGHDIDWLMWSSFWDSIYRTFWAGDRGLFVSRWMVQANVLLMLLMLVGWPVMVTLVLGGWISLRSAIHDWGTAPGRLSLLWVLLTCWTLCSLLWFSLVIAAWGSTTARYLLYLVPALAVLWVRGRAGWQGRLRWVGRCADACLCGMVLLVVLVYRFGGWRA
ncbi:MAG: hypothetical protein HC898_00780 [Phycisphaerales bacterium]|nr:hypothetical protein [Phycisphaerales bacterium]